MFVFEISDPTCLRSIKDCVTPRLNVGNEYVDVYVRGSASGFKTPVVVFVEIDEVEDDDLERGDEWALKVDTHGGRGFGIGIQVTDGALQSRTPNWQGRD